MSEWFKSSYSNSFSNCVQARWAKSSHSSLNGSCVEARWRKSGHSMCNGHCAEVRDCGGVVQLRDSKLGEASAILSFTSADWAAFIAAVKAGGAGISS